MTEPTQAQIEVAVSAYFATSGNMGARMKAALTAAAQVEHKNPPPSSVNMWDDMKRPLDRATIEACAQKAGGLVRQVQEEMEMTEPTQAQIEAAAKAWYFCMHCIMHDHEKEWKLFEKKELYRECAKAALTAAAGVVTGKSGYEYISTHDEVVAAEREACAQVAEKPDDIYGIGKEIAAAIRARGDKP